MKTLPYRTSKNVPVSETPLFDLAQNLVDQGFDHYDYAKAVLLGDANPRERLAGRHPWPTREHDGQEYVYSVPVHAGFSAVRGTALFIGKDPWRDDEDPRSWLVSEANLTTGEGRDHLILSSSVDAARHLWLQLAPGNYSNIPQWGDRYNPDSGWLEAKADIAYHPPRYDQIRIEGDLSDSYYLDRAALREGLGSRPYGFEDIVVLESMVEIVWAAQHARDEGNFVRLRQQALDLEAGKRAVAYSGARAA